MGVYGSIPICIHMGILPYDRIWEYSHMNAYGNVPICIHMGTFPYTLKIVPYVMHTGTLIQSHMLYIWEHFGIWDYSHMLG